LSDEELAEAGYKIFHSENFGYSLIIPIDWHTSVFPERDLFTTDFYNPQERTEVYVSAIPYTYQSPAELLSPALLEIYEDPQVIEDAVIETQTNYGYRGYNVSDPRLPHPMHPDRFTAVTVVIFEEDVDSPPYGIVLRFELRTPLDSDIRQEDSDKFDRAVASIKMS
jgi:hypothetical protein